MKKIIFSVFLILLTCEMYAHALWIETNAVGKKGQKQEVKICYGEYAEFSPEKVKDWYSDVKDFTLWLATPDNQKIKLDVTAAEDFFSTSFTPEKEGVYTLLISHSAKDLGRTTLYQFNASTMVMVGKEQPYNLATNSNPLKFSVNTSGVRKPVHIQAFFKEAVSEKMTVTVFSPNGWTRQLKGDAEGNALFTPEWKGKYMIEVSRSDDEKGEHHGAAYTGIWRCATYLVAVK